MEIKSIYLSLKRCGIKKGDTVMLHGDAGIAAQLDPSIKNKLGIFFDQIINYVGERGTILVPAFTYGSCKSKYFDHNKSPSELGLFSENFRKKKFVKRTKNPIFSFSIYGKKFKYFNSADTSTCFGKNSIFDLFHKVDGKIICLGCDLDRITFTHYVEEFFGVQYRYYKTFKILTKYKNSKKIISISYYVRKLKVPSKIDLQTLYSHLKKNKKIKEIDFGRYNFLSISSNNFFRACLFLLKKNKYSLIRKK